MKWEPFFARLLKHFIRTDKLKKEERKIRTSGAGDGQPNEPEKEYGGRTQI